MYHDPFEIVWSTFESVFVLVVIDDEDYTDSKQDTIGRLDCCADDDDDDDSD
jgi:hypothetical protein